MQLGDLGADVIKVERPDIGDQTRGWHPPQFEKGDDAVSAYYASVNRNKRSITIDLKTKQGREIVRELATNADILVENFRVGTTEKWGLGYEQLAEENPELVYCSLSGYGEWGPYADRPAYDLIILRDRNIDILPVDRLFRVLTRLLSESHQEFRSSGFRGFI